MHIRPLSRRGVALAATVLTLGLGTGAAAAGSLAVAADDARTAALQLRTAGVRAALDTTFQRYADTMHDLVAAAATQPTAALAPTVSRTADRRLPGAHQIVVVGPDRAIRAEHTVDGSTPPPDRTLTAEPELARGLELARDTGRLIAGPTHVRPADAVLPPGQRLPTFQLIAPVHNGEFRGWVVLAVRANDLLRESLRGAGVTDVATVVTETSPDGMTHEVARWAEGGSPAGTASGTVEVATPGHPWQVRVRPTTALVSAARTAAAPLTLLGAVVVSVFAAGLLLVADRGRTRARTRVRQAAEARRAELARHRAALEARRADLEAHRAELTRQQDRALAAERQLRVREAELTGFAAAATDHLHAPLHTIAGFTELMLEDGQLDPAARGFLQRIAGGTGRMQTLVDDLLVYTAAHDTVLRPGPVDADGLALGVVAGRLDHVHGERPGITVGDLPTVTADAELLAELLGRLVDNAVRFARPGTGARVTVGAREHAPGWWRIEVADRGIGVPEEQRTRIFAPFHRAPGAEGLPGAGLGLAVCRRIVDLHGGEIGVEPNPGGGSVFFFTVPAATAPAPAGP